MPSAHSRYDSFTQSPRAPKNDVFDDSDTDAFLLKELGGSDNLDRDFDTNTNEDNIRVDTVVSRVLAPDGQSWRR